MSLIISDWPCVSALILIPLLGAIGCCCPLFSSCRDGSGRYVQFWSVATASLTLLFILLLSVLLQNDQVAGGDASILGTSLEESYHWIPAWGVSFKFVLDGLSYPFCLLVAIISLVVLLWGAPKNSAGSSSFGDLRAWCATILFAEAGVMGSFLCTDLLGFYVFYEAMLIPALAGIAIWGGTRRLQAVIKFALYTLAGSVFLLVAIAYCGWRARVSGTPTFDVFTLSNLRLFSDREQVLIGAALMLAFAVKTPIVPFHSWLPDTYREAPPQLAAFIAALLGKVGIYAMLRFVWPLCPLFFEQYGGIVAALAAVSVVYGALVAIAQTDLRRLLAFSSISHLGFCVLGVVAYTSAGYSGAVFQSFSHGIVTAALFLLFGLLVQARQSGEISEFGGLASRVPRLAALLMVFSFAAVSLPITSSFVGEFLILLGAYREYPTATTVSLLGVVLGAVYTLTAYLKVMFGTARPGSATSFELIDIGGARVWVAGGLAAIVLLLGIYPAPLLNIVEPIGVSSTNSSLMTSATRVAFNSSSASSAQLSMLPSRLLRPASMAEQAEPLAVDSTQGSHFTCAWSPT